MDFGMMMMMIIITFEKASFVCIWVLISTFVLLLKIAPAILVPWDADNFLQSS
jgi:hypothetical protein